MTLVGITIALTLYYIVVKKSPYTDLMVSQSRVHTVKFIRKYTFQSGNLFDIQLLGISFVLTKKILPSCCDEVKKIDALSFWK